MFGVREAAHSAQGENYTLDHCTLDHAGSRRMLFEFQSLVAECCWNSKVWSQNVV